MNYKELIRVLDSSDKDKLFEKAYREKDEDTARQLLNERFKDVLPSNKLGSKAYYKGKNGEWTNVVAGYFTDDKYFAHHYGEDGEIQSFYLLVENPYTYDFQYSGSDGDYPGEDGEYRNTWNVVKSIINSEGEDTYDAFILYNVGEGAAAGMYDVTDYIVLNPKKVKSYEVFTFDDEGELITLSQRFNLNIGDIRY